MRKWNRRTFLTTAGAAFSAVAADTASEWRNRQPEMSYRRLGRTGFMVSELAMGGNFIRPTNFEHVLAAHERGLNYFDTAPDYGRGASERGYARVIRTRPRDSFFLTTKIRLWPQSRKKLYSDIYTSLTAQQQDALKKVAAEIIEERKAAEPDYLPGYFTNQDGDLNRAALAAAIHRKYGDRVRGKIDYKKHIITSVEGSLRRLETDYVDVLTCPHGADLAEEIENFPEAIEAFEHLKKQGKVRYLSVSAHTEPAGVIEAAIRTGVYSMAMVAYNATNGRYVEKALTLARDKDFGILAMKSARPFVPGNGARVDPARIRRLHDAVPGDLKVPQKAYVWTLRNPAIATVVSEMINSQMVNENLPLARQT